MITVYETGVRTEYFYFTTNGRNETQNTNISHADIPVYLEDGTAPAADTPYDGSSVLAFMDVTGNTKQADGESLYLDDGVLRLDAPDTDEGEQCAALVEYIEPEPPLPTVSTVTAYLKTPGSSSGIACSFGERLAIKDSNNTQMLYDPSKYYIVYVNISGTPSGTKTITRLGYICFNDSTGLLYAYNRGSGKYCHDCTVYVCDSDQVSRVVVQNASNVKYSAFFMGGYYYVCDGVQTDWTDDLSSIGYSVLQGNNAYLTTEGSSGTTDTSTGNSGYKLYNASGARISSSDSSYYVLVAQYLYDGTDVTTYNMNTSGLTSSYIRSEYSKLNYAGGSSGGLVYRIVYTIE
jgi:hypothetical protein